MSPLEKALKRSKRWINWYHFFSNRNPYTIALFPQIVEDDKKFREWLNDFLTGAQLLAANLRMVRTQSQAQALLDLADNFVNPINPQIHAHDYPDLDLSEEIPRIILNMPMEILVNPEKQVKHVLQALNELQTKVNEAAFSEFEIPNGR